MNIKQFFQNTKDKIVSVWEIGIIQKSLRITYDVVWNVILFFLVIGLFGALFAGGVGAGYFASLVKDEPIRSYDSMERDIYNYEETSKLYFANDIYIGDIRSDLHREEIPLEGISPTLIDAVIATEDSSFFEHNGVVPKAIVRAVVQEVTNTGLKSGGSTLTQQLIKNQVLTNEVSFDRKAKEILLAMRLEKFFDKEEILEAYLNVIPYGRNSSGRNIAGVKMAAEGIFDTDAKELNLPQAAYLAGLPQSPSAYTPFISSGGLKGEDGLQPGLNRMKVVLKRMLNAKLISEQEYNEALQYDIVADFADKKTSPTEEYGYLTYELEDRAKDILIESIAEDNGYTMEDLENDETLMEQHKMLTDRALRMDGYHIHSTIDQEIYDAMQEAAQGYEHSEQDIINDQGEPESVQAAGMMVENNTGRIISFVGGREFSHQNEWNYAVDAKRSFGSTIKPLLVYAPALEKGVLQPGTPIADIKTTFPDPSDPDGWTPNNYNSTLFYGINPARKALAHSYNVSTIRAYELIYQDEAAKHYLTKLGFSSLAMDYGNRSLSIGATTVGVTLEENTNAFSSLGNDGEFANAYMIDKITTKDGEVVYEHESDQIEVYSPQTSYLMLDMMRDVISDGTATSFSSFIKDHQVDWAGKTGTSQDHEDAWFVGVNPNVTFGAWIGYDKPTDLKEKCPGCSLNHSQRIIKFWSTLVNAAGDINPDLITPHEKFQRPDGIVERSYCAISGMLPSKLCREAGLVKSDLFNIKYVPTEEDDSLISGNIVMVDGEAMLAGPKTPEEFIEGDGLVFNPDFLKPFREDTDEVIYHFDDINQLYPRSADRELWEKIKEPHDDNESEIEDEGKDPIAPTSVTIDNRTINWNKSSSKNIVGYYIYAATKSDGKFKKINHTRKTEFKAPNNNTIYYVTAVDYFGRESKPSKEVIRGKIKPPKDEKPDKDEDDDKDKGKDDDKDNDTELPDPDEPTDEDEDNNGNENDNENNNND